MIIRLSLLSEVVAMAFDTIRVNKMRSALTVLGVVIGITSIVGMTSMIRGFDESLRDGVFVAVGDVNGDGIGDIIAGAGDGGSPRIVVVNGNTLLTDGAFAAVNAPLASFFSDDSLEAERTGVRVAVKDVDNDGLADIVTGSSKNQPARIRVFTGASITAGVPVAIQDLAPFNGFLMLNGIYVG